MIRLALFLICVLLSGALPLQAQTTPNCTMRALVVERLAKRFGESLWGMGLGANNAVVEVFRSVETGSWTILVTSAGGVNLSGCQRPSVRSHQRAATEAGR